MKAKFNNIKVSPIIKMSQLPILILSIGVLFSSCQSIKPDAGISMKEDVTFLASDDLEGREIGTDG